MLNVQNLSTEVRVGGRWVPVVDQLSFLVDAGETLAIVGESGCGKSMTALSLIRLLQDQQSRIAGGSIRFEGEDLATLDEEALCALRGRRMAMIFQEPMTSLNPVLTIGRQITEALRVHKLADRSAARGRAIELLNLVRIPDAATRLDDYPHRLSGGMRQRAMIAAALACDPALLIADEPTTALDVTIQAQILALLRDLQRRLGLALIFITHDLGVVAEIADRVLVMYAGRAVEAGPVTDVLTKPRHPYTQGLLRARPQGMDRRDQTLAEIPGRVPPPGALPEGCGFHPRCSFAIDACRSAVPALEARSGHAVACIRAEEWGEVT
ncbi:MAG: ABC transporter ATP-binding protein [Pseudomonadota bacterium]